MPRMIWLADVFVQLRTSPRRALALEVACLLPALALVAIAGFGWGGYFWLQNRVQMAADQALRAALATSDPRHRQARARAAAERVLGAPAFNLDLLSGRGGRPVLRIAYDAAGSPLYAAPRLAPMPPSVIVRLASRP